MHSWIVCCGLILSQLAYSAIQVEQVGDWAQKNPKGQIEDFLDWVNLTDPSQLEWFTLMRDSQSAQGASPDAPRAIVFGPESKFIFTFNGHPEQVGNDEVEMIFFRETPSPRWEMRKLSFHTAQGKVVFSEANPAFCLSCHQNPVRPIWNPYDSWPGAYGENDDAIPDFENDKYARTGFTSSSVEERKLEFKQFSDFVKNKDQHNRYSKLKFPEGSPVSPYSPEGRYFEYRFRPNLKLTESLVDLHSKTLLAKLKSHPQYESSKALLLALFLQCQNGVDDQNSALVRQMFEIEKKYRNSCLDPVPWNRRGYTGEGSRQHHLMFLLGVEYTDFSLEKSPEYWSYFGGELYSHEVLMMALYEDVKASYPELPVLDYRNDYDKPVKVPSSAMDEAKHVTEVCKTLGEIQGKTRAVKTFERVKISNPVITCVGCHSRDNNRAPYLPFEEPSELKKNTELVKKILSRIDSDNPETRMPPTRPLSQKEKEAIREWLKN